jgi:putative oxidoreductase
MADWTTMRVGWEPRMLSIFRITTGLLFLEHGINKLFNFPVTQNHAPYNIATLVPGAQGLIELIGGILIVLGLFTRPAAFILAGDMAVAYFMAHAPRNFFPMVNGGDAAILYCFAFLYMWVAGGGAWSLDRLRTRESSTLAAAGSRV